MKLKEDETLSPVDGSTLLGKVNRCFNRLEQLYVTFLGVIRVFIRGRFGPKLLELRVPPTFTLLITAIGTEELFHQEDLIKVIRTALLKQIVARRGGELLTPGRAHWAHSAVILGQTLFDGHIDYLKDVALMVTVLRSMSARELEVFTRFYHQHQTQESICKAMQITEEEVRRVKLNARVSYAKARAAPRHA